MSRSSRASLSPTSSPVSNELLDTQRRLSQALVRLEESEATKQELSSELAMTKKKLQRSEQRAHDSFSPTSYSKFNSKTQELQEVENLHNELSDLRQQYKEYKIKQNKELQELHAECEAKDELIARLQQQSTGIPFDRIEAEMLSYSQFSQTAMRKLSDANILTQDELIRLKSSVQQFQELTTNNSQYNKMKLSSFFETLRTFAEVLVDATLDREIMGATPLIIDEDKKGNISQALHESEMQRLRLQNQLFRVQHRLDQETEDEANIREQMKQEHAIIQKVTTRLFPKSPYFSDDLVVESEMKRIENTIKKRDATIENMNSELESLRSSLKKFAEETIGFEPTEQMTNISIAKTVYDRIVNKLKKVTSGLDQAASLLSLPSSSLESIIDAVSRLVAKTKDYDRLTQMYDELEAQNDNLSNEVQDLQSQIEDKSDNIQQVSEELKQNQNQYSQRSKELTKQISDLQSHINVLSEYNAKISQQLAESQQECDNLKQSQHKLTKEKQKVDSTNSNLAKELHQSNLQSKSTIQKLQNNLNAVTEELSLKETEHKSQIASLQHTIDEKNIDLDQLRTKYNSLIQDFDNLSQTHQDINKKYNDILQDNADKNSNITKLSASLDITKIQLTKSLQNVNELTKFVEEKTSENQRLVAIANKVPGLQKLNSELADELEDKNSQISRLSQENAQIPQLNLELKQLTQRFDQLTGSYNEIEQTYHNEHQKGKQARKALKEVSLKADQQSQLISESSKTIEHLTKELQKAKSELSNYQIHNSEYSQKLDSLTKDKILLQDNVEALDQKCNELHQQINDLVLKNRKLKADKAAIDLKLTNHVETESELDKLRNSLSSINNEYKKTLTEYQSMQVELREKSNQLKELQKLQSSSSSQLEHLYQQKRENKTQIQELALSVQQLTVQNKQLNETVRSLENQNKSNVSQIVSLSESQMENQKLRSLNDDYRSQIDKLQRINDSLNITNEKQNKKLKQLTANVNILSEQSNDKVSQLLQENTELQTEVEQMKTQISEYISQIDKLHQINEKQSQSVKELHKQNEKFSSTFSKYTKKLEAATTQIQQLTTKLDQKNQLINDLRASNKRMEDKIETSDDRIHSLEESLNSSCDKSDLETSFRTIQKLKALVSSLQNRMESYEEIQNQLSEQKKFRHKVARILNEFSSDKNMKYLQQLYSVFSIPFNSRDYEFVSRTQTDLVERIQRSILELPIERNDDVFDMSQSFTEKLQNIVKLLELVHQLFKENEDSMKRLSSLVSTQHSAIVKITQSPK